MRNGRWGMLCFVTMVIGGAAAAAAAHLLDGYLKQLRNSVGLQPIIRLSPI